MVCRVHREGLKGCVLSKLKVTINITCKSGEAVCCMQELCLFDVLSEKIHTRSEYVHVSHYNVLGSPHAYLYSEFVMQKVKK